MTSPYSGGDDLAALLTRRAVTRSATRAAAAQAALRGGAIEMPTTTSLLLFWLPALVVATISIVAIVLAVMNRGKGPTVVPVPPLPAKPSGTPPTTASAGAQTDAQAQEEVPLTYKPVLAPRPPPVQYDPVVREPTAEPRDEPRWPSVPLDAELGPWGYGQFGAGGYGPDGRYYAAGELAGIAASNAWGSYDFPTAAIMRRDAVGPWERVGAVVNADASKIYALFARKQGANTDKYSYRITAGTDGTVPIEVPTPNDRGQWWINDGELVYTPLLGSMTAQIYSSFRLSV